MSSGKIKVRFWGVRGSIATPLRPIEVQGKVRQALLESLNRGLKTEADVDKFIEELPDSIRSTYGGNTSCLEVQCDNELLVFDAGSGFRELGEMINKEPAYRKQNTTHLFLSHTHWDHICGLPFFVEAYQQDKNLYIYSPKHEIREHIGNQHLEPNFPVTFKTLAGIKGFIHTPINKAQMIGKIAVTPFLLDHPGDAYGYRVDFGGKSLIYATDSEFRNITDKDLAEYNPYTGVDLFILDAMYTFDDGIKRADWGHGSAEVGVDICSRHGIKSMAIFHHEPTYSDKKLESILGRVQEYASSTYPNIDLKIFLAQEGADILL